MDADGTNQTNVTANPPERRHHAWSPDGEKIAYLSATTTPTMNATAATR